MDHRRPSLALALLLAGLCSFSVVPAGARICGDDLTDLLYSNQFSFDPEGIPIVNIGLMEGRDEARFTAEGGLVFWSQTEGGTRMATPRQRVWTARVLDGRPAQVRYWAVAERLQKADLDAVVQALERWRQRGFADVTSFELGAVFGFRGQVFDNRATIVVVGGSEAVEQARAVAEGLYASHGVPIAVHAELVRPPEGRIVVEEPSGQLRIESPRVLMAVPAAGSSFTVLKVQHGLGTRWEGAKDRSYRGALYLAVDRQGKLALGNQVNAEQLLAGLVPAEIFPDSPMEALKAQAVAARGILLSKLGTRHLADPFLLCSQVHCQVYSGMDRETPRTTQAVAETRGELLFRADGLRLVDTVYHASSGGHTADNETVWPGDPDPDLRGRPDTASGAALLAGPSEDATRAFIEKPPKDAFARLASRGRDSFRWEVTLGASEVDELVARSYPQIGHVLRIEVAERGRSGRVKRLDLVGERGEVSVHRELPVRRLFGGLRSGLFVLDVERDAKGKARRYRFKGGGFGHGVGMCQVGAIGRAEKGQSYRQILEHYYNGAVVRRIY